VTAVDTNVVIRLLTQDERQQSRYAKAVFASEQVWIAKTVLLEASWVLGSVYGFEREAVRRAFTMLLGLPHVHTEDSLAVLGALSLMEQEIDFADALHLESRPSNARFLSFDKTFLRRAQRAGVRGIIAPRRVRNH
jgi:predicted nucleic-acid-binding protein